MLQGGDSESEELSQGRLIIMIKIQRENTDEFEEMNECSFSKGGRNPLETLIIACVRGLFGSVEL